MNYKIIIPVNTNETMIFGDGYALPITDYIVNDDGLTINEYDKVSVLFITNNTDDGTMTLFNKIDKLSDELRNVIPQMEREVIVVDDPGEILSNINLFNSLKDHTIMADTTYGTTNYIIGVHCLLSFMKRYWTDVYVRKILDGVEDVTPTFYINELVHSTQKPSDIINFISVMTKTNKIYKEKEVVEI